MASNLNDARPLAAGEGRAFASRGTARIAAVQALYQMDLTQTDAAAVIAQFTQHRFGHEVDGAYYDRADEPFFSDLVLGVVRAQLAVDPLIARHLAKLEYPPHRSHPGAICCGGLMSYMSVPT